MKFFSKNKTNSKTDYSIIKRLYKFLKPYTKYLYFALSLTIIVSAITPLRPYLIKTAIDSYITTSDSRGLLNIIIVILSLLVFQGLLQFSQTYIMQWIGQKVLSDIRIKLFAHINNLSMKYLDKNPVGRLVTRVTNDIEALNELFSSGLVMVIADVLLVFWIIIFMFYTNVELALISLSVLPILITATFIFKAKVRNVFRNIRTKVAAINSFLSESISGITDIKFLQKEENRKSEFDKENSEIKSLWVKTVYYHALFFPIVEFLSALALALVLYYTAENMFTGTVTIGILVAFLQYAEMFFRPVRDLAEKFTTLQGALAAGERIFEVLDTQEERNKSQEYFSIRDFNKEIKFNNISFSYDGQKQVLKNISFEIKKGERVAIVGSTGSGKTSIINLLLRFYNYQSGSIEIDGKDIQQIDLEEYYSLFSLVMQDVFLFSRSIKDNISLGRDAINEEGLEQSIKEIGALDFISHQENGINTILSERGNSLSQGQKQLISFSRAYSGKPQVLILDEASSNIDSQTELLLENAINKLLENRTAIVIAHRLSTIRKADKILVLHKGEIVETGNHNELIKLNGFYSKLYKLQFSNSI